jgi:hypothetical protein
VEGCDGRGEGSRRESQRAAGGPTGRGRRRIPTPAGARRRASPMGSKRLPMVPWLSSAARMPLPGATMAFCEGRGEAWADGFGGGRVENRRGRGDGAVGGRCPPAPPSPPAPVTHRRGDELGRERGVHFLREGVGSSSNLRTGCREASVRGARPGSAGKGAFETSAARGACGRRRPTFLKSGSPDFHVDWSASPPAAAVRPPAPAPHHRSLRPLPRPRVPWAARAPPPAAERRRSSPSSSLASTTPARRRWPRPSTAVSGARRGDWSPP